MNSQEYSGRVQYWLARRFEAARLHLIGCVCALALAGCRIASIQSEEVSPGVARVSMGSR